MSVARRIRVPALRRSARLPHCRLATPAVCWLSISGVAHVWHDSPQHKDAPDGLVLGGVPRCDGQRGLSALLFQRQLGLRRYETAWMVLHKLRRAMVNTTRQPLYGDVEMDDTWVGGPQAGLRGSRQLKGRKAALVLVAVEKRGQASGRVRMAALSDLKESTVHAFVKEHIAPGSTLYTDAYKSFDRLSATGVRHVARHQASRREFRRGAVSVVPLADRAIGNLQQWLIGTYHGVSKAQLQVYLDEFVFRHNRRRQPMAAFQTLLGLGSGRGPTPYRRIRGARDLI